MTRSTAQSPSYPGPIEIEATDAAEDVEDFATEIEPGTVFDFHGRGVDEFKWNPASSYFRFAVAFVAGPFQRIFSKEIQ